MDEPRLLGGSCSGGSQGPICLGQEPPHPSASSAGALPGLYLASTQTGEVSTVSGSPSLFAQVAYSCNFSFQCRFLQEDSKASHGPWHFPWMA